MRHASLLSSSEWTCLSVLAQTLVSSPNLFPRHFSEVLQGHAGESLFRDCLLELLWAAVEHHNNLRSHVVYLLDSTDEAEFEAGRALSWALEQKPDCVRGGK